MVLAIFSLLSVVIWAWLTKQENLQIEHAVAMQAQGTSQEILLYAWERINDLDRMAKRIEQSGYQSDKQWLSDAELYVEHDPGFHALLWVDADRAIRHHILQAEGKREGERLWAPEALNPLADRSSRTISNGFALSPDSGANMAVQIMIPIAKGAYRGEYIVAVLRLEEALRNVIERVRRDGYFMALRDGQAYLVGSRALQHYGQGSEWVQESYIPLPGVTWHASLTPGLDALAGMQDRLKEIVLAGGIAVALLLAWAMHLYLAMQRHATAVKAANAKLQQEIAERRQAQEALKASEGKYRALFGDSSDAIMLLDHLTLVDCNDATLRLFGCGGREQFLGRRLTDFMPAEQPDGSDSEALADQHLAAAYERGRGQFELVHQRLDGHEFSAHLLLSVMRLNGKGALQATVRDISEQRRVQDRERKLLEQNRFLIRKLMRSQEDERSYIARELHDELGQSLTAIDTMATLIKSQAPDGRVAENAGRISSIVDNLFDHVRSILSRIRSPVLESTGLVEAVQELLNHHGQVNGLQSSLSVSGEFDDLSATAITAFYRVMQEALTNIVRHAKASRVDVRLSREDGTLLLVIDDNGKGADLDGSDSIGLGMIGMRERIESLNGSCIFGSSPGKGMRVSIAVPMVPGNIREQSYG